MHNIQKCWNINCKTLKRWIAESTNETYIINQRGLQVEQPPYNFILAPSSQRARCAGTPGRTWPGRPTAPSGGAGTGTKSRGGTRPSPPSRGRPSAQTAGAQQHRTRNSTIQRCPGLMAGTDQNGLSSMPVAPHPTCQRLSPRSILQSLYQSINICQVLIFNNT